MRASYIDFKPGSLSLLQMCNVFARAMVYGADMKLILPNKVICIKYMLVIFYFGNSLAAHHTSA